eukprot:SAG31_NODE_45_length_31062_cov_17.179957_24_plen_345_part_00
MEATRAPWAQQSAELQVADAASYGGSSHLMPPPPPRPRGEKAGNDQACSFQVPVKIIRTPQDVSRFIGSTTYAKLVGLVNRMQKAAAGQSQACERSTSPVVAGVIDLLCTLSAWVEEIPPIDQAMRYGNKAFRQWHQKLVADGPGLLSKILPTQLVPAAVELQGYLAGSFGDPTRIDYGTGHETCFVALLLCMFELGLFTDADLSTLVLKLFPRYRQLMRQLQLTYRLEPAGTHGVWGLDDYHILPYLFGASQLIGNPLGPATIHDPKVLEEHYSNYMYYEAIRFIRQVKKGPFFEHSPMLNDISQLPSWDIVAKGMCRMYEAEVLQKQPVIQHFLFGSILLPP